MTEHLSATQIERFTSGELGDNEAVLCALHLDGCPLCSARVAAAEPLAPLFAHAADPIVPSDLAAAVLSAATSPPPTRPARTNREVWVGAGLLLSVAAMSVAFGEPVDWFTRAAVFAEATSVAARAMTVALPSSVVLLVVPLAASAAAVASVAGPTRIGRP